MAKENQVSLADQFAGKGSKLPEFLQQEANDWLIEVVSKPRCERTEAFKVMMMGANINAQGNLPGEEGWTPLMYAVARRNDALLEVLLHFQADPNIQNAKGTTALIMAVGGGEDFYFRHIMREYQMDQKIYLNLRDHEGVTAMMLAAWQGRTDWVERMAYAGADILPQDNKGQTALDYARKCNGGAGDTRLVELLEKMMADCQTQLSEGMPTNKAVPVKKPISFKKG